VRVKESLAPFEGGLPFYVAVIAVEQVVQCRSAVMADKAVDFIRIGVQCLSSLDKTSAVRAYELMLKKRAEKHAWRMVRDDYMVRAIVRICCFTGREDEAGWAEIKEIVEGMLSDSEKEALKEHLGRRDGSGDTPVYVLRGAGALLSRASASAQVTPVLRKLCQVFEDLARSFDRVMNHRTVNVHLESLERVLRDGGASFEGAPFVLDEIGPSLVELRVPGR